jgi:hypothetical protein
MGSQDTSHDQRSFSSWAFAAFKNRRQIRDANLPWPSTVEDLENIMSGLDEVYAQIQTFKEDSLRKRIASIEAKLHGADSAACQAFDSNEGIGPELLIAAFALKRASSQINEVVHAVGILVSLPHILRDGELVEALSLAAGNTGKTFDLETNQRVAEFKFIDWKGGPESIRQNQLFKDFYLLAEFSTPKERYLYVLGADHPTKFLTGGRALDSVMSRNNKLWTEFQRTYGGRFSTVSDYYGYRKDKVKIVDLANVVPRFAHGIA